MGLKKIGMKNLALKNREIGGMTMTVVVYLVCHMYFNLKLNVD